LGTPAGSTHWTQFCNSDDLSHCFHLPVNVPYYQ
jgi:hypothetical protein